MRKIFTLLLVMFSLPLSSCAGQLDSYVDTKPLMKFDQFFNGPVQAHGIVQDRSGKVIKQFDVAMLGTWHGDTGTLDEHFNYYNGKTQHRTWHIRKTGPDQFVGTADDIIGEAPGRQVGNAIEWHYVMRVPLDSGKTIDVKFDDWMFQMNGNTVINRNYMSKFGVYVGELTIVMQKKS